MSARGLLEFVRLTWTGLRHNLNTAFLGKERPASQKPHHHRCSPLNPCHTFKHNVTYCWATAAQGSRWWPTYAHVTTQAQRQAADTMANILSDAI